MVPKQKTEITFAVFQRSELSPLEIADTTVTFEVCERNNPGVAQAAWLPPIRRGRCSPRSFPPPGARPIERRGLPAPASRLVPQRAKENQQRPASRLHCASDGLTRFASGTAELFLPFRRV